MSTYCLSFFFFNDTATTEIYTLSLHDALPISTPRRRKSSWVATSSIHANGPLAHTLMVPAGTPFKHATYGIIPTRSERDRKSTRLNSSHSQISYAVFCLKKKKKT